MKRIADVLRDEHRLIRRAAACLDRMTDEALEGAELPLDVALDLLEFFEDFADVVHQAKEERCLFPSLLEQGLARHRLSELSEEHGEERVLLRSMRHQLEVAAFGGASGRAEFLRLAARYAALEREHAEEEDRLLLPLVEEYLSADAERAVRTGFHEIERRLLPRRPAHYAELVDGAAARLASIASPRLGRGASGPPDC